MRIPLLAPFLVTLLIVAPVGGTAAHPSRHSSYAPRSHPPHGIDTLLAGIREISYFPAHGGWSYMWQFWNASTIDSDFARIAQLHATTVRLIIPAQTFGYPTPAPVMQTRLANTIGLAAAHGLRVHLTLFDWWGQYGDLPGSKQWAAAVLAPYRTDRRLAMVELKNELDPTRPAAVAWARAMIPYLRSLTALPITVSAANLDQLRLQVAALRAAPPDFYTFHCYTGSEPALTFSILRQAQHSVPGGRLFVGETGFSTVPGNYGISGSAKALEAAQDHYYRTVDSATSRLGLPPAAPWDLYDFSPGAIPPSATAALPAEFDYGLLHANGSPKPAAVSTSRFFLTGTVDQSFNNGFEQGYDTPDGPLPTEWQVYHGNEARFALDRTMAHTGTASARISNSTGDASGVPAFYVSPIDADVTPNRVYRVAVLAAGRNATGTNRVALAWFDAGKHYLGLTASTSLPVGTSNWTLLTATGVAPADAAFVQLHLQSGANSGTVWFDDVTYQ